MQNIIETAGPIVAVVIGYVLITKALIGNEHLRSRLMSEAAIMPVEKLIERCIKGFGIAIALFVASPQFEPILSLWLPFYTNWSSGVIYVIGTAIAVGCGGYYFSVGCDAIARIKMKKI